MPAKSVSTESTSNVLGNTLNKQAESRKMANAQCGLSEPLVGPQTSQSDHNHVSTHFRSKEGSFQERLTPSLDFTSLSTVVDLIPNEPLTRKRQRHEAETIGRELE